MKLSLANDVDVLGNMLDRLSEEKTDGIAISRSRRFFARGCARPSLVFRFYRTYLAPGQPVTEEDRQIAEARPSPQRSGRNPAMEESIFNFLRDVLLFRFSAKPRRQRRAGEHTHFVLKFQQATGPIMAKGPRGHRLLHLQQAGRAVERSGRRAATVWV